MAILIVIKYNQGTGLQLARHMEGFGTSPGTLTQLEATHVGSPSNVPSMRRWLEDTEKGVKKMTEFDRAASTPVPYYAVPGFTRVGAYA
jgi:hypothetical protein